MVSYSYQYFIVPCLVGTFLVGPSYYYYHHHYANPYLGTPAALVGGPLIERTIWPPREEPLPPPGWTEPLKAPHFPDSSINYLTFADAPSKEDPTILEKFPESIRVNYTKFENWAGDISSNVWIAYPENAYDVVDLANWARLHSFRLRPSGYRNSWSPLTISEREVSQRQIMVVDTTEHLNNMLVNVEDSTFWAEPGIPLEQVLSNLEQDNLGLATFPSFGEMSLGGILATGSHGLGIPLFETDVIEGHSFGSLSNLVASLTAVVFDPKLNSYILKDFQRSNPEMAAFLVNFGTSFITNITLRVGPLLNLHYESRNVNAEQLFSSPLNRSRNSFLDELNNRGRVLARFSGGSEASLKTWTVADSKPDEVTEVGSLTFSQEDKAEGSAWGTAKSVLLYANPEEKVANGGWAILTNKTNIQRVVHEFYHQFNHTLREYKKFHPNLSISFEAKVTGLDDGADVGIEGAVGSAFSPLQPIGQRPDLNCSVWINLVSSSVFSGQDFEATIEFFTVMENFILDNFNAYWSVVRVEWPSGWSFTKASPWSKVGLTKNLKRIGAFSDWGYAVGVIQKYDPSAVFADSFVNDFLFD